MKYFLFGAAGYPLLELAWRGRTHISMALAGGLSTAAMHAIGRRCKSLPSAGVTSAAAVTVIEAACGLVWNKEHQVWDYRRMPLNWHGQVCLPYSVLWGLLGTAFILLDKGSARA